MSTEHTEAARSFSHHIGHWPWCQDERGEAIPVVMLFLGMLMTVLLGVHIVVIAMARTATQLAADAAVTAAQLTEDGPSDFCDPSIAPSINTVSDFNQTKRTPRECEGVFAALEALAASASSVVPTRMPEVVEEPERGVVTALVFGGAISPIFGGIELAIQACGPLSALSANELASATAWQC